MADCRLCRWYQPRYSKVVAPIWARAWCGYRGAWMSGFGMGRIAREGCSSFEKRSFDTVYLGRRNERSICIECLYWLGYAKHKHDEPERHGHCVKDKTDIPMAFAKLEFNEGGCKNFVKRRNDGYQPAVAVEDELTPPVGSDGEDA